VPEPQSPTTSSLSISDPGSVAGAEVAGAALTVVEGVAVVETAGWDVVEAGSVELEHADATRISAVE